MFGNFSYIGYTLLFCIPPLVLFWLRREFFTILTQNWKAVVIPTLIITVYGSIIWPIAIKYGAWAYRPDRISNVKLFDYVYLDDVIWWLLVNLLLTSFVVVSIHYEKQGNDLFSTEVKELLFSFKNAFRGFSTITLERNSTIHVAITVFVLLEGILFRISWIEWLFVAGAIGLVLGAELMNSAVERLATKVSDGHDPEIKVIKDTAAAAVLVGSAAAVIIGLKIFFSRILSFLG